MKVTWHRKKTKNREMEPHVHRDNQTQPARKKKFPGELIIMRINNSQKHIPYFILHS